MSLFDLGAIIAELSELLDLRGWAAPDALPVAMRKRVLVRASRGLTVADHSSRRSFSYGGL